MNEADSPTGAPGDVTCFNSNGDIVLAVEVKDRALTLSDVRSSTRKARESSESLSNLLFATGGIRDRERSQIHESVAAAWASGLNIWQVDIVGMASAAFALLSENWRPEFLRAIGTELDARGDHAHRRAWHEILSKLADRP